MTFSRPSEGWDSVAAHGALCAGVDEAGRGPLAGPVVAAAVILDPNRPVDGLGDSKQLSARRREILSPRIKTRALSWSVAWADAAEIDTINILQATLMAMRRAVAGLAVPPRSVLVDGNRSPWLPGLEGRVTAVVQGDRSVAAISAASILAKVHRDALMRRMHDLYPNYGFDRHKGYPTSAHRAAIVEHGPCVLHRYTFAPVARIASRRPKS